MASVYGVRFCIQLSVTIDSICNPHSGSPSSIPIICSKHEFYRTNLNSNPRARRTIQKVCAKYPKTQCLPRKSPTSDGVSLWFVFSARVPLVHAFEHCNINDAEIESSRYPGEGERARSPFSLSEISTFEGVSNRALPSRIIRNLFFRAPPVSRRDRGFVYRWHRNRRRGAAITKGLHASMKR